MAFSCLPGKIKKYPPNGLSFGFGASYARWQHRVCAAVMNLALSGGESTEECPGTAHRPSFDISRICRNRLMTLENFDCIFYFEPLSLPFHIHRLFLLF